MCPHSNAIRHGFTILSLEGPLRDISEAGRGAALDDVLVAIDRSYAATSGSVIRADDLRVDAEV